ncbi:ABC transporter permease [Clostridium oryzae]|uniref:Oligopeptide transport system permease protein OppB n=1 Tax=Clostridium oryzae TaxID=1450648 RepID=A0A1V4IGG0_9CLOT|nr:ABC transporter permease [Clostridium oryzae]OPJ59043.1 oligopeptide transport system permease protein OppB [Clostridium oryzae]
MLKFIVKRFFYMLLTIWVVITLTFCLMHAAKGDPLASVGRRLPAQTRKNLYQKYGLDKPLFQQYIIYMKGLVTRLDLGESYVYPGTTVNDIIKKQSPVSAQLGMVSIILGLVVGLALGIIAALKKGHWPDYLVMFLAILGITVPSFVLAALFQYYLTVKLHMFPTTGWGGIKYMVLPALSLSFATIATYGRFMRSSASEVLNQDYILTAKAKGVSNTGMLTHHVMRNAITPTITMLGPQIASIFTGTFVIESVFSIPGIGRYFISCISNRDYPVILGTTIFVAILYIVSVFVVDVLYVIIDPRVKLAGSK